MTTPTAFNILLVLGILVFGRRFMASTTKSDRLLNFCAILFLSAGLFLLSGGQFVTQREHSREDDQARAIGYSDRADMELAQKEGITDPATWRLTKEKRRVAAETAAREKQLAEEAAAKERQLAKEAEARDPVFYVRELVQYPDAIVEVKRNGPQLVVILNVDKWYPQEKYIFLEATKDIVPAVFKKSSDINDVSMKAIATFVDIRGHQSQGDAFQIDFSRENSKNIVWDNVQIDNLPRISNSYWEHPSFSKRAP